jgi:hypothetical protein
MKKSLFEVIHKSHVELSIQRILKEGYPSNRKSSTYDLVFEGTAFPPKYVLSLAGFFADKRFISHDEFSGGEESKAFEHLRSLGFEILPKTETQGIDQAKKGNTTFHYKYAHHKELNEINLDLFKNYFQEYIAYCKRSNWLSHEEAYKFKFGHWVKEQVDFKSQSDQEVLDLCRLSQDQEYEPGIKGVNFILSSLRYSDHFIELKDVEVLRKLSDPDYLLEDSDMEGSSMSFPKLSVWTGTLFPERFSIYANEELIKGIAPLFELEKHPKSGIRAFNMANYCLGQIKDQIQLNYPEEALSLIQLVFNESTSLEPVDWTWLTQDFILYLVRRKIDVQPNYYWVNQGERYKKELGASCVSAPVDELHHHKRLKDLIEGDIVIHYANTEIKATSIVKREYVQGPRPYDPDGNDWYSVDVSYQLLDHPISIIELKDRLKDNESLLPSKYSPFDKYLGVNQSYLLMFNKESYDLIFDQDQKPLQTITNPENMKYWIYSPGKQANKWDEFYNEGIMALGWDDLGDLSDYESKDVIEGSLKELLGVSGSKKNDATANWDFANEMQPGDLVFVKKGRRELLGYGIVKSEYRYHEDRDGYQSVRDVEWKSKGNWPVDHDLVVKALTNITSYGSDHPEYKLYHERLMAVIEGNYKELAQSKFEAKNIILYGPPGTGKTYSTKAYAVSLAETGVSERGEAWLEEGDRSYQKTWKALRKEERIEFVTFHQSFAYEDFVQGIRPDVSSSQLSFDRHEGVFKLISEKARKNYEQSQSGERETFGTFDEVFNSFMSGILQEEVNEIEIPMRSKGYYFTLTKYDPDEGRMKFKKKSGGTGHDLLFKNLKRIYEGTLDYGIDGLGVYYYPFVDRLKEFALEKQKQTPVQPLKHFVLIIDEINRANISRVLGELITLLEPDKRLGQDDELIVKLPSGEPFGVPPNLHIIGTMNTADKSIAHLDVALRRRFKFKPVYPDFEKAGDYSELLQALNIKIESQLSPELTIGHSFFMNEDPIENIMNDKVIPLMLEYFNHRIEEVEEILESIGIKLGTTEFGIPKCIGYEPEQGTD